MKNDKRSSKKTKLSDTGSSDSKPPELFIGLVGAMGTDLSRVNSALSDSLTAVGYLSDEIRLSHMLHALKKYSNLPTKFRDEHIDRHIRAGNEFRRDCERNDAVALLGVGRIKDLRNSGSSANAGRAYIINSLKNPEEVKTLRKIYGDSFYLVAAYSPLQERKLWLAKQIAQTRNKYPISQHSTVVDELIKRDEEEVGFEHGQQSRDSFHRADVFVDTRDAEHLKKSVNRFVELLFGNTFHTPTKSEYGMFVAHAAALRSAELSRQVGSSDLPPISARVIIQSFNQ